MLVTNSLTHSLTHCCLVNLMALYDPNYLMMSQQLLNVFIGPESDHWLCLSVTPSLTHWLTHSLPFSKLYWFEPGMWRWQLKTCWSCYYCWCCWCVKMPTENLLRLLLLLVLMPRKVLTMAWCRFGSWSLVMKLNFVQTLSTRFGEEFEVEVQAKFWNWNLVSILLLRLGDVVKWLFGQDFEIKVWSKCWCLVEILNFGIWSRFV